MLIEQLKDDYVNDVCALLLIETFHLLQLYKVHSIFCGRILPIQKTLHLFSTVHFLMKMKKNDSIWSICNPSDLTVSKRPGTTYRIEIRFAVFNHLYIFYFAL